VIFDDVEKNIIDAVKDARRQWLDRGNTANSHEQMKHMHNYAAYAAYFTMKSAYLTADDGTGTRNCNHLPMITNVGASIQGLTVEFSDDGYDPDPADDITFRRWRFGDGETVVDTSTPTHTYAQPGIYQVMCYIGSGSDDRYAANVLFEYIAVGGQTCRSLGYLCCDACGDTAYPEYDGYCSGQVCCEICAEDIVPPSAPAVLTVR
jgi:hypothetical protein